MSIGTPIEAVLFDADGVVQTPGAGWRPALEALCGVPGQVEAFLEDLFAAERPCLTGDEDFEAALAGVLARWRSTATVSEALRAWELIEPQESVLAFVDGLRAQGTLVGLATNQQSLRAEYMLEVLGFERRFDALFVSCRIGHMKPGTGFFEHARKALDLPGSAVLFIDDHPQNVAAARDSGFNAEVYDLSTGPEGMDALLQGYGLMAGGR